MKNKQNSGKINRRRLLQQASAAIAAPLLLGSVSAAEVVNHPFTTQGLNGCQLLPGAQFYVGIDNKGLWPNLTKLPNGEIAAAIYNHPRAIYGKL